jgi:3-oxoacyl-[acyl-carrier protein] reductase
LFTFNGKVVWITGSSTGIGRAIALKFAEYGANVIVHGNNNVQEAERTFREVENLGGENLLVLGDLTDRDQVNKLVSEIREKYNRIDILINNAGTMVTRSKIEDLEQDTWNKIIDINLNSVFHVTQAVLPLMKQQKEGSIINMTSLAARNGGGGGAVAYAAAKGAVSTLTKGLAKELAGDGIRVNGIGPGIITTPFHDRYSTDEMRKGMAEQVPLKREGSPEEVAGAALYLASDYASYITGEVIEVNGGLLMD